MFKRILVICVGNICRSPMGEYLLKHKLAHKPDIAIESAGVGALVGKPADPTSVEVLREHGIDAGGHRARPVTAEMLAHADLILAMEEKHLKHLYDMAPQVRGKAFLFGKWIDDLPVPDPYRQQRPAFDHAFKLIDQASDAWLKYLDK
ncbi:low molecular weight protein-tyrosine-phosphatase [Marinobacter sp. F4216]|uniref:low molecular weight protein-tyrosine-phosphatase n=1 Tax=Marinobacter sp. F4216 TaxID=2874281 RepID=UPI001CBD8151|nr:low molecular weight protein-tyrosine-phosphatase [Marinobacter sp. F4216]MBZ2168433.1 low molecular weight phosphotyrosine protein phosphatase [Marinobacter sp. F4216]